MTKSIIITVAATLLTAGIPCGLLAAPGTRTLPDLLNPDSITVDGHLMVVTDGASVHLYDLENFSRMKTFGKKGEGPREFKFSEGGVVKLQVHVGRDRILVNSRNRVTFFSRTGDYLGEVNVASGNRFLPVGDGHVGYASANEHKTLFITFNLYDADFAFRREIFRKKYYVQPNERFNLVLLANGNQRRAVYQVAGEEIYVEGEDDTIHVFDPTGRRLRTMSLADEPVRITPDQVAAIRDDLERLYTSPLMKRLIQEKGDIPETFPARIFRVADDRIYLPTHRHENGRTRFLVMDLNGTHLKTVLLPLAQQTFLIPYPYTIHGGRFYQLVEDEDTETWRLVVQEIR